LPDFGWPNADAKCGAWANPDLPKKRFTTPMVIRKRAQNRRMIVRHLRPELHFKMRVRTKVIAWKRVDANGFVLAIQPNEENGVDFSPRGFSEGAFCVLSERGPGEKK
jgi:hypothetical protein